MVYISSLLYYNTYYREDFFLFTSHQKTKMDLTEFQNCLVQKCIKTAIKQDKKQFIKQFSNNAFNLGCLKYFETWDL